ncbi:MAG TPA: outer membrane beta-barrel protein, partial [Longimicrobiales bacterium]|nr:outer membrane beta-barrel protein [Longimicrobiales bacterium]
MKVLRNVVLAALLVPLATAPLSAQSWKWDIGINGGYSWFTKMLDAEENDIGGEDIKFNSGPLVGAQLGFWFTPNFGLRANARYGAPDVEASDVDTEFIQDVNLWGGTGDLLFRFMRPADEYTGMEFLPYVAVGAGLKWINPP